MNKLLIASVSLVSLLFIQLQVKGQFADEERRAAETNEKYGQFQNAAERFEAAAAVYKQETQTAVLDNTICKVAKASQECCNTPLTKN